MLACRYSSPTPLMPIVTAALILSSITLICCYVAATLMPLVTIAVVCRIIIVIAAAAAPLFHTPAERIYLNIQALDFRYVFD